MTLEASGLPWQQLHANLRGFIGRRIRNEADAEDLVQRVLLQLVKGLDSLRDPDRLHAWIYRTARNVIIDYYRASGAKREFSDHDGPRASAESAVFATADDDRRALQELAGCLTPMLEALTPAHREAIRLTELEGLSQAEAARRAGVSLSGMKSRVQRGRNQLRTVLEACCRIDLDSRGGIAAFEPRQPDACGGCGVPAAPPGARRGTLIR